MSVTVKPSNGLRLGAALAALLALGVAGCTVKRSYLSDRPVVSPGGELVWLGEVVNDGSKDSRVYVIACHRSGTPACLRMRVQGAVSIEDYARWRAESDRRDAKRVRSEP